MVKSQLRRYFILNHPVAGKQKSDCTVIEEILLKVWYEKYYYSNNAVMVQYLEALQISLFLVAINNQIAPCGISTLEKCSFTVFPLPCHKNLFLNVCLDE